MLNSPVKVKKEHYVRFMVTYGKPAEYNPYKAKLEVLVLIGRNNKIRGLYGRRTGSRRYLHIIVLRVYWRARFIKYRYTIIFSFEYLCTSSSRFT